MLFPGTVDARFRWADWCSDAGLMGGSDGADIGGPGVEGSESVAICGSSVSKVEEGTLPRNRDEDGISPPVIGGKDDEP